MRVEIKITKDDHESEEELIKFETLDLAFYWEPVPDSPFRLYMKTGPARGLQVPPRPFKIYPSWQLGPLDHRCDKDCDI